MKINIKLLKRFFNLLLIIAPLAVFVLFSTAGENHRTSAATTGSVNVGGLNMRTGPGTNYENVKVNGEKVVLTKGDYVAIVYNDNGWYYVTASYNGKTVKGYVSATYITTNGVVPTAAPTNTPTPTAKVTATPFPTQTTTVVTTTTETVTSGFPRKGYVMVQSLRVRSGAGTSYGIIDGIYRNQAVTVKGAEKASDGSYWYRVTYTIEGTNRDGYVSAAYIAVEVTNTVTTTPVPVTATPVPTSPAEGPVATPTPKITSDLVKTGFPYTGIVNVESLNVRKDAGAGYEVAGVVVEKDRVTVKGVKQASNGAYWYQIEIKKAGETIKGYVNSKYLNIEIPAPTYTPTPTPTEAVSYTPTPTLEPGALPTPVPTVVDVTYSGQQIQLSEVSKDKLGKFSYTGKIDIYLLNMRTKASLSAESVGIFEENTKVYVLEQVVGDSSVPVWYRVALKKDNQIHYGYMSGKYVTLIFNQDIYGLITENKTRLKKTASSSSAYVKADDGSIITLSKDTPVFVLAEVSNDGKWFKVRTAEGAEGFVQNTFVMLDEGASLKVTPTPTATPIPTEVPVEATPVPTEAPVEATPTPTEDPNVTPTPVPTQDPNLTPTPTTIPEEKPTATPTVAPTATPVPANIFPTQMPQAMLTPAAKHKVAAGSTDFPLNAPGTSVSGYGHMVVNGVFTPRGDITKSAFMSKNPGIGQGTGIGEAPCSLVLYDKYTYDFVEYRHIGFEYKDGNTTKMGYGYIVNSYIKEDVSPLPPDPTPTPIAGVSGMSSADFEAYMTSQGFPDSYKDQLRKLHEQHPTWVFKARQTNLSWDDVIAAETEPGTNLIPNSYGVAWKSLATGAYKWETDTFILYDGSTWVTASEKAVCYYMDPRNWLDSTNVFMFESLKYNAEYQDEAGVEALLVNTPFYHTSFTYTDNYGATKTMTYAQAFIEAAKYSGVSPYHLAARVRQEVVTGTSSVSNSVTGTVSGYERLYNFYNIGAYHSTVAGGAVINGLKYARNGAANNDALNDASLIPWTDPYKAIVGGAYIIAKNYIARGQDTIYLEKFNVTGDNQYYHQYMANVVAPSEEANRMSKAYANVADRPIVFEIPVFRNMPYTASPKPGTEYNPNNWLKTLEVYNADTNEKLTISPNFSQSIDQEYYVAVNGGVSMVNINAVAVSSKATVQGKGIVALNPGTNTFTIMVTAENGTVKTYTINVIRQD